MTESLKRKYEKFTENIGENMDVSVQKELFLSIAQEEITLFNKTFGMGNPVRLCFVAAMCEVLSKAMRETLDRRAPGMSKDVDFIKKLMGVVSVEPQGR